MADVGDSVLLTLTVDPADGTTTATVQITSPSGAITNPGPTPSADRATWTAPLTLTAAGRWRVTWTVTGVGAGVEHDAVYAIELPPGRVYATLGDLASATGEEPTNGDARRLIRASALVDSALIGAIYETNPTTLLPTDAAVVAALRDAVCAQVQWWAETGDDTGSGAAARWDAVGIGNVKLSGRRSRHGGAAEELAPAAQTALRLAGLLPITPQTPTGWWGR
ncbi:MAG: hypothetical protein ACRDTG_28550 [Pseudonocardiaceae bacterium]